MDFFELIKNLGSVGAVIAFIAAALVFLKGSVYKGAIAALESTVNTQTARITTLEANNQDHTRLIERLSVENKILLSQRPSSELIAELGKTLKSHGDLVRNNHREEMIILKGLK